MIHFIDTHIHLDGEEFDDDRDAVVERAREAGATRLFVPAIDLKSVDTVLNVCCRYPGFAYPMIGLHPEEVKADWREVLAEIKKRLQSLLCSPSPLNPPSSPITPSPTAPIAIGEVGLDYYWSREFEHEQLEAFEEQVCWSVETGLPLMIHCRKAQNEMVALLRRYEKELHSGVFHCFTGNAHEAAELLRFEGFALGIGGVLTFKKSNLPETLKSVPLDRIVLETDAPYMAPVPHRGKRNESYFIPHIIEKIAEVYGVSPETVATTTTATVERIFHLNQKDL